MGQTGLLQSNLHMYQNKFQRKFIGESRVREGSTGGLESGQCTVSGFKSHQHGCEQL